MVSFSDRVRDVAGRASRWGGALTIVALGACAGADGAEQKPEHVGSVVSALEPGEYTDASGQVHIRIKTCDYPATTPQAGDLCAYCTLEPDWLLIGGGAEIEGSPSSARLKASYPYAPPGPPPNCTGNGDASRELSIWVARSHGTSSHRLRAYVVGLKIDNITVDEIESQGAYDWHETTSTSSSRPVKETPSFLSSQLVIGGGAELLASIGEPVNGYLTELRPADVVGENNAWRGAGVFNTGSQGGIKVFSIGLNPCLVVPGWDQCLAWKWRMATTGPVSGYGTASAVTPYPWVTAGIGAKGVFGSAASSSRFLADLIPFSSGAPGFTVRTKDQGSTVSGSTTGYAFNLMKGGAEWWTYNAIRFNSTGTAFSRPSGTAPVTLQQSVDNPDAAPRRWHLEPMGNTGRYRIRNGNPTQGTECACRIAGTTSVRVTTCGTSNDFLFTRDFDGSSGVFKLRNVANDRCIDNNGQGATNSNLVFRTCGSGYQANQSLFLDHYSWPP
jgi:hypothetical protein